MKNVANPYILSVGYGIVVFVYNSNENNKKTIQIIRKLHKRELHQNDNRWKGNQNSTIVWLKSMFGLDALRLGKSCASSGFSKRHYERKLNVNKTY